MHTLEILFGLLWWALATLEVAFLLYRPLFPEDDWLWFGMVLCVLIIERNKSYQIFVNEGQKGHHIG